MAEVNTAKRRSKKERGGAKSKMMAKRGDPARQVLSHLQEGGGSSRAESQYYFHVQVDGAARVRVNITKLIGLDPRHADLARAPR